MQSNKDHDDFSDRKFRETLNITIINNFLDFQSTSDFTTLSSFFHHMRNSFKEIPHIFVSTYASDSIKTLFNSDNEHVKQISESHLSTAFTEWLVMWLLQVLHHDNASVVHKECKDLLVSLLHLIRTYSPNKFRHYISYMMNLLAELNEYVDKFEESGDENFKIQNYFQTGKVFVNEDKELVLVDICIIFSNPDECEKLQEKITSILEMVTTDITQFLPDKCESLSKIYCIQIELGDLPLKKESLKGLNTLIKVNGLLFSVCQLNYIFDCMQAVINFCCSYDGIRTSEFILLEQAAALCLQAITENINKPVSHLLNNHILGKFSQNLIQILTKPKLLDTCNEFQSSFVKGIIIFIQLGYEKGCPISINTFQRLTNFLHQIFFKLKNPKIFVSLFVYLISSNNKFLSKSDFISTDYNPNQDLTCRVESLMFESMREYSCLWTLLYDSLLNSFPHLELENVSHLHVLSSCIEILIKSFLEVIFLEKRETYECCKASRSFPLSLFQIVHSCVAYYLAHKFSVTTYNEIIYLYGILLSVQDIFSFTQDQVLEICNIISIPFVLQWKSEDLSDFQCTFFPVDSMKKFAVLLNVSHMIQCLELLVLLPFDIYHKWKYHILLFCLSHEIISLRITAIRLLPSFFYYKIIPQHSLSDVLPYILNARSIDILREVAIIVGKLSCVISGACLHFRKRLKDGSLMLKPEIICKECNKFDCNIKDPVSHYLNSNNCLADLFLQLLSHSSEIIRKESLISIMPFLNHIRMFENLLVATMQLLVDPDPTIRNKFCNIAQYVFKISTVIDKDTEWLQKVDEILILKLKSALVSSKCSGNVPFQKSVVYSTGEIGKIAEGGLLLITVISLLESFMTSLPTVKVVAIYKLKEIADAKKLKMQDLFKAYKDPICKFVSEFLFSSSRDVTGVLVILEEIRMVFGFHDLKSFINQTQRYILPYIVSKEETQSSVMLESLSTVLHIEKSEILINNFPYIFSHFVRHCTKCELEQALLSIQKWTNLELGSLLRCNYQLIHNELLLHLSTHYEQVFSGLTILALKSGNMKDRGPRITHTEEMANYLQPKLLGFLVFFDAQMLKSSMEEKKLALESLVSIMKLMGTQAITAVRFKLMATLRIALRFKDGNFPKICCKAWNTFVHSIEMPCLGPLLNQIIVALLPLLELEPTSVSEIFHYLIMENRYYLGDFFHDLYFIPETSELQEINAVLKDYSESPSSITDFHSLLLNSLKGVSHENLEVRLHALEKLKKVLQSNQTAIYEHLLGRENVDNLLSNLVAALIDGCRESDTRIQVALGECLGELGAIDPGRLKRNNASSKDVLDTFHSSIDNEQFAYALIQELVHSFLAADECGIQDCSACAIQEILRFYKCSDEKGSSGNHLWKRFPPDIQEILAVLFHSQYKPLERSRKKFPSPIYQSKIGNTYRDWTKNWFYSLLQKVKKENPFKLFHSCSIIVKYDLNCTLFLLPHLVVYALLDSTEVEKEEICTEILSVLNHGMESSSTSDLFHLSSQTIFSVFDHITKWRNACKTELLTLPTGKSITKKTDICKNLDIINSCINKIPQILLAKASFSCKAYTRSLMHLEQYLKEYPEELRNNISFIQKIYSALDESDGVAGVAAVRKEEASLTDLILENEAIGDMQGAFACYEKAIKLYPNEVSYYGGLLKCFLGMDQPTTAVFYANGVLNERPEWKRKLNRYRVDAAWKLGSWQDLEIFLQDEVNNLEWTIGVGNILYLAKKKDIDGIEKLTKSIRSNQIAPLSAASMEKGSYLRGYEHLIRMHMLTDLQLCMNAIFDLNVIDDMSEDCSSLFDEIIPTLNLRKLLVQSSPRYQEPIHDLHRILLKIGKMKFSTCYDRFDKAIASCWLQSAKLARKSGFYQRAYSCLLEAGSVNTADFLMEKTKWFWNKGEKEQAIHCLKKGILEHFPSAGRSSQISSMSDDQQLMCAKAKLLLAVYSEESSIVDSSTLIDMYKEVVNLQPNWEASHFHLAKYYDKVLNSLEEPAARAEMMVNVVHNFRLSLKHGCKNVYHSLPRLLDIWFDLGTILTKDLHTLSKKYPNSWKSMSSCLDKISSMIVQDVYETVPMYLFLTAFPQMISRICHSHPSISLYLQKFISRILASYSQQTMWMMMAVSKSSYPTRIKRCKQIFQEAILLNPILGKFISDTTRLADKLIELSNKNLGDCSVLNISENFPSLLKLIEEKNFSQILLPTQNQMIVTLPTGYTCNADHNPFPCTSVYIKSFANTVDIFQSLQKPKKLIVIGSDGKQYPVMCKPKDDLRKDCRLMEFNNLVNRYLKSDPEARRRELYIRTYAVMPLNEECGLIEWVPNLSGLRNILSKLYKMKNIFVTGKEIRAMMPSKTASPQQRLHIFKTKFLPRFPPVFHDWFLMTFPDPTAWYLARLAYARTTAVMSMVGYIVGLGDRHGENILFDSSCGDIVHVDLNCLFNKGEIMEFPEVVPFRLTHNMVDAMGPTGYEGAFRKACEVTMRVMRSRTDALMSVLQPLLHDPLLEWSRNKNARSQQQDSGEITNEQALTHVKDIELRLNGIIKTKRKQQGLPLSIEGQVNHLIQEAVDIRNLSQMYIGWAAYM